MVDSSSVEQGASASVILTSLESVEVSYAVRFEFKATNNQAEYEAFIVGLKLTLPLWAEKVKIWTDSQLVANHLNESFQTNDEEMEQYLKYSKRTMTNFKVVEVEQIPRAENFRADILAIMVATSDKKIPQSVPVEVKAFKRLEVICLKTGTS